MSISPKTIWQRLSPELQAEIQTDITLICQEIIDAYIRTGNPDPHRAKSPDLHSSIESPSADQQSRKSSTPVCASVTGRGPGLGQ